MAHSIDVYESVLVEEQNFAGTVYQYFLSGMVRRVDVESIFLGHDNSSALILVMSGNPISTASFTKMELKVGNVLVSSLNVGDTPIRWNRGGYALGEVQLHLGFEALEPGVFNVPLIVYSTVYPNGMVWDKIRLLVYSEVESKPLPILPSDGLSISEYVSVGIV